MRRQVGLFVVLVTGVFVQGASAQMSADSAAQKAITLQVKKSDAAATKKDVNGMLATLAPDYEGVDYQGRKMNREKVKLAMTQMLAFAKSLTIKTTVNKVVAKGNEATADVTEVVVITVQNAQQGGKLSKLVANGVSVQTWVKKGTNWLQRRSKAQKTEYTLDGKPFTPPGNR